MPYTITRLDLEENLETLQVGKNWTVEAHLDNEKGVVVSITDSISAKTTSTWRSPTNWTQNVVSNTSDWNAIPRTIRYNIADRMMVRHEKAFAKAEKEGYYFPLGSTIAFRLTQKKKV